MDSDVMTVLDKQTKQAEALINRLSKRLDYTRELKTLEQERHQLTRKITGLEQRQAELDGEITHWRELSQRGDDDGREVIEQLEAAWSALTAGGALRAPTTSLLAPAPKPRTPAPDPVNDVPAPAEGETEIPEESVVTDALDVLDTFFADFPDETPPGDDTTWHTDDFFSAAQGLEDELDEADWLAENNGESEEDDWWQPANETTLLPEQEEATEPPILMDSPSPATEPKKSTKQGLFGRFF